MVSLVVSPATVAAAPTAAQIQFIKSVDRIMVELGPQSAHAQSAIKQLYRRHMDLFVLQQFDALEAALSTGGMVPLPPDPLRFNVKPRVDGPAPIAEKDLDHQASYISGRAAAIGALLEIASRVKSGPVEVTSLARHTEYQEALRKTNSNATTSVPTHTMGMAFDIALVNSSMTTVREIRDVLNAMQGAGDILFIGERRQLVFHVVPHPARLGHFAAVYERAIADSMPGANVIAATPVTRDISGLARPVVAAEVVEVRPTDQHAAEWWAADGAQSDMTVNVSASAQSIVPAKRSLFGRLADFVAGVMSSAWNALT